MTISPHPTQTVRGADPILKQQLAHYAGVKARLGAVVQRRRVPRPVALPQPLPLSITASQEEVVDSPVVITGSAPLNMLALPSWRFLVALAAVRHGFSSEDILGPRRGKPLIAARCEAMGLVYQHTPASLPRIGLCLNRDHTTVLHALRKIGKTFKLVDLPVGHKTGRPAKQELAPARIKSKTAWEARP